MDEIRKHKLEVAFFSTSAGVEPVRVWLRKLNKIDKTTIGTDIKTVQFGWPLGMPLVRHIEDGIWEVRSSLSDGKIARILFFNDGNTMILVNGFIKKVQRAPKQEISLAKKRMQQFKKECKK